MFRLVSENLGRWVWARMLRVYKAFTKTGSLAKRRLCLGPAGVIKLHSTICIVLLSEFVSQNAWLQHWNQPSPPSVQSQLLKGVCSPSISPSALSRPPAPRSGLLQPPQGQVWSWSGLAPLVSSLYHPLTPGCLRLRPLACLLGACYLISASHPTVLGKLNPLYWVNNFQLYLQVEQSNCPGKSLKRY